MLNKKQITSNAAMLSSCGTSTHDTGIHFSTLNPYEYFHSQGINLQDFTIRFLQKPRANGVAITCRANISGIIYTVGAADYDTLLAELLDDYLRHRQSIARSQERKRVRCISRYIDRHSGAMALPVWFS